MAEDRKRIIDYPETTTVGDSDYLLMSQYNESLNAYESKKVLAKKVGGGGSTDEFVYHLTQGSTWESFTLPTVPTGGKVIVKYYERGTGISGECEIVPSELAVYDGYTTIMTILVGSIPLNMARDSSIPNKLYISTNGYFDPTGSNYVTVDVYIRTES